MRLPLQVSSSVRSTHYNRVYFSSQLCFQQPEPSFPSFMMQKNNQVEFTLPTRTMFPYTRYKEISTRQYTFVLKDTDVYWSLYRPYTYASVYIIIPLRTHYVYGFIIPPYTCHFMQCLSLRRFWYMRENCWWKSILPCVNRRHLDPKSLRQALHLSARENYGKGGGKRGVQQNFSYAG